MISYQILTKWWSIFHEKRPQRCFIRNTLNSFFNRRSRTISHNFRYFESSQTNQSSLGNRVSKTIILFSQRKFSLFFLAAVILILVERLSWFVLRFMFFLETTPFSVVSWRIKSGWFWYSRDTKMPRFLKKWQGFVSKIWANNNFPLLVIIQKTVANTQQVFVDIVDSGISMRCDEKRIHLLGIVE